jgi:hypothetical protein
MLLRNSSMDISNDISNRKATTPEGNSKNRPSLAKITEEDSLVAQLLSTPLTEEQEKRVTLILRTLEGASVDDIRTTFSGILATARDASARFNDKTRSAAIKANDDTLLRTVEDLVGDLIEGYGELDSKRRDNQKNKGIARIKNILRRGGQSLTRRLEGRKTDFNSAIEELEKNTSERQANHVHTADAIDTLLNELGNTIREDLLVHIVAAQRALEASTNDPDKGIDDSTTPLTYASDSEEPRSVLLSQQERLGRVLKVLFIQGAALKELQKQHTASAEACQETTNITLPQLSITVAGLSSAAHVRDTVSATRRSRDLNSTALDSLIESVGETGISLGTLKEEGAGMIDSDIAEKAKLLLEKITATEEHLKKIQQGRSDAQAKSDEAVRELIDYENNK